MIMSICSMSSIIASFVLWSDGLISVSSRRRASGVRRSCEMPASISARSASSCSRSVTIWLKLRLVSAATPMPRSGSGSGDCPEPTLRAAIASRANGLFTRLVMNAAPNSDSASAKMPQPAHCRPVTLSS